MAVEPPDREGLCRRWVRNWAGWRFGVVSSASADLLVAWYAGARSLPAERWAEEERRFGAAIQQIRRSRLTEDTAALERGCRDLLTQADAEQPTTLGAAFHDLREKLTWLAADTLDGCGNADDCPMPQVCRP